MGDIFDDLAAEAAQKKPQAPARSGAPAGGDVFDQLTREQQAELPAFQEPEGNAFGRFFKNTWQGMSQSGDAIADLLNVASGQKKELNPETKAMGHAIIQSSIDQWHQAADAWNKGNHVEAFGHALATTPLIGPAAAHAADVIGGEAPEYDKFGNVVKSGRVPDVAEGLLEGASMIVPSVPKILPARVANAMRIRIPGFNRATPEVQNAYRYLTETGGPEERIAANAAVATDSPYIQKAQKITEQSPLGAVVGEKAGKTTEEALEARSRRLEQQAAPSAGLPGSVGPEQAGSQLHKAMGSAIEGKDIEANTHYAAWRQGVNDPQYLRNVQTGTQQQITHGINAQGRWQPTYQTVPVFEDVQLPVDIRPIKAKLGPAIAEIDDWIKTAQKDTHPGYLAAKQLLESKDYIPAQAAEAALGSIKKLSREAGPGRGKGLADYTIPQLQKAIDDGLASNGAGHLKWELENGRAATKAKYDMEDVLKDLTGETSQTLKKAEPVGSYRQMVAPGDGNITMLRSIDKMAPGQLRTVGRGWLNDVFKMGTEEGGFKVKRGAGMYREWDNLGDATKQLLFDPAMKKELDNFFLGVKKLAENPNPSGSGLINIAAHVGFAINAPQLAAPAILGPYALAKIFRTPAGVRLLTDGMSISALAPGAGNYAAQIMRAAGIQGPQRQASGGMVGRNPNRSDVLRSLGA